MVANAQEAILANARSLLETTIALEEQDKLHHAAHFAALCQEECAKCLMLFESVEKVFAAGAKKHHLLKGKLIGVFHYLTGKLSIIYLTKHVMGELMPGSKIWELLNEMLLKKSGAASPDALPALVEEYLSTLEKEPRLDVSREIDDVRKATVYCDFEDGNVLTPARVPEEQLQRVITSAKLAVGLLDMAMNQKFNWNRFVEIYPKDYGHESLEEEAARWLSELKQRLAEDEAAGQIAS